ncbi:MAG: Fe-S cluster assembly protein SufD [bacterium]|nr:Fe-S cluster assembly protein SufD [bacterium]
MSNTSVTSLAAFAELEKKLAAEGPDWLRDWRRASSERFEQLGWPTAALEEWKSTSLDAIAKTPFRPAPAVQLDEGRLPAFAQWVDGPRLVFLDGRIVPGLSQVGAPAAGAWCGSLTDAIEQQPQRLKKLLELDAPRDASAMAAINASLFEDGAAVLVDDGATLEQPLHVMYLSSGGDKPAATHSRTLIHVGDRARATVVESFGSLEDGAYWTNAASRVSVGDGAELDHYTLQLESDQAYHIGGGWSTQGRDSHYRAVGIDLGGRIVRHDLRAVLDGERAQCALDGLYATHEAQHVDNHTVLDHAKPHGDSRELYKGVLGGRSRGVFSGRIIVREDAQKTDAKQSNPNLLLSDTALAHTRPQLEIYADDVKCTHGATVGRLDADAIFYLRSRGLSATEARHLMVSAFAGEVLERIAIPRLREALEAAVATRLTEIGG